MSTILTSSQQPNIVPPDERLCPICHGLGHVYKAGELGQAIPCPTNCNAADNRDRLSRLSHLDDSRLNWYLRGATFHNSIRPQIDELINTVYDDEPAGFWYIHGPNGCGKTYILAATVNEAIRQLRSGIYMTTSQLLEEIRKTYGSDDADAEGKLLRAIRATTVLCLDEFGRERATDFATEKLFQILNQRYEAAHFYKMPNQAKLTLIASNTPEEATDAWFRSRLTDNNSHVLNMARLPDRRGK